METTSSLKNKVETGQRSPKNPQFPSDATMDPVPPPVEAKSPVASSHNVQFELTNEESTHVNSSPGVSPSNRGNSSHNRKARKSVFEGFTTVVARRTSGLNGHEDQTSRIDRMYEVVGVFKGTVPPDSVVARYWYSFMLILTTYMYVIFTRTIVYDDTHTTSELIVRLVICFFLMADYAAHRKLISFSVKWSVIDLLCGLPWHMILFFHTTTYELRIFLALIPATKLVRVPTMFSRTTPDIIDITYVIFYYRILPTVKFMYWFLVWIHTVVTIKQVCAPEMQTNYHEAITWVWVLLTSAPLTCEVKNNAEAILSGFLMTCSLVFQGYVVGAMSMLVFSYNVQDENRTQMLVTLEMLKHYQLPRDVQHEMLSFQYHILHDSNIKSNSHAVLEKLPPTMLRQIQLYVKVDILNKVTFFDDADAGCKLSIANVMTQEIVEPEENIIVAGEVGEAMYFMLHGLADVFVTSDICVATLRRGDFFGEIALLSVDCKRKATVTSLTYCDLLVLSRREFDSVIENHPSFLQNIVGRRSEAVSKMTHPTSAPPQAPPQISVEGEESTADFASSSSGDFRSELDVGTTHAPLCRRMDRRASHTSGGGGGLDGHIGSFRLMVDEPVATLATKESIRSSPLTRKTTGGVGRNSFSQRMSIDQSRLASIGGFVYPPTDDTMEDINTKLQRLEANQARQDQMLKRILDALNRKAAGGDPLWGGGGVKPKLLQTPSKAEMELSV